jgi:hypothetical protein
MWFSEFQDLRLEVMSTGLDFKLWSFCFLSSPSLMVFFFFFWRFELRASRLLDRLYHLSHSASAFPAFLFLHPLFLASLSVLLFLRGHDALPWLPSPQESKGTAEGPSSLDDENEASGRVTAGLTAAYSRSSSVAGCALALFPELYALKLPGSYPGSDSQPGGVNFLALGLILLLVLPLG